MLRRAYEVLEQAACTLARSAEPIQRRLSVASSTIGRLRSEDFGTCRDLENIFLNLTDLMPRKDAPEDDTQLDFSHLSDEQAEQLAANLFDAFVDVAKIHLTTQH
jgi:hypothetical protein